VHGAHRQAGAAVDRGVVNGHVLRTARHGPCFVGEQIGGLDGDDVVVVRHDDVSDRDVPAGHVDTIGVEREHRYGLLQILLRRPICQDRDALDEDAPAVAPEIEVEPRRVEHRDIAYHHISGAVDLEEHGAF